MRLSICSWFMVSLLSLSSMAKSSIINFQDESLGSYSGGSAIFNVEGTSVLFTGLGLNIRDLSFAFPFGSSRVLSSSSDIETITMELLGGATTNKLTFHNWISGVYTEEVDTIFAQAFDASNNLLGSITSSNEFITLNFKGMTKITFDDLNNNDGYVLDDLKFSIVAVPEPSTWVLIMTGFLILIIYDRRRLQKKLNYEI